MLECRRSFINPRNGRWYRIDAGRDLLGDLIVYKTWGSATARHWGQLTVTATSASGDVDRLIEREVNRRLARGYELLVS